MARSKPISTTLWSTLAVGNHHVDRIAELEGSVVLLERTDLPDEEEDGVNVRVMALSATALMVRRAYRNSEVTSLLQSDQGGWHKTTLYVAGKTDGTFDRTSSGGQLFPVSHRAGSLALAAEHHAGSAELWTSVLLNPQHTGSGLVALGPEDIDRVLDAMKGGINSPLVTHVSEVMGSAMQAAGIDRPGQLSDLRM